MGKIKAKQEEGMYHLFLEIILFPYIFYIVFLKNLQKLLILRMMKKGVTRR